MAKISKKRRPLLLVFIIIYLLLLITVFLIVMVIPKLNENLGLNTYTVKRGTVSRYIDTKGLIVKNEKIYTASTNGHVNYKYTEGTKVRKGERLFEISGSGKIITESENLKKILKKLNGKTDGKTLTAGITGLISYYVDGYEKTLTPNFTTFKKIKESDFKREYKSYSIKKDYVDSGEILYKLIDNNRYYIVCYINNNNVFLKDLHLNDEVSIKIQNSKITANIVKIYRESEKRKLVFQSDIYYKDLTKVRFLEIKILLGDYIGLKIPNESIIRKNGYDGVYKITSAKNKVFVPVNILSEAEDFSIVSSKTFVNRFNEEVFTIDYYDNIVRNP